MTWKQLLKDRRVQPHKTSIRELDDLRAVVERDLADAAIEALSADRRFATAYNAILQLVKMVIACEGYRVVGTAHHQTAFEALELAMGPSVAKLAAYFDVCRRKRNVVDYDMANVATGTEAREILEKAREFEALVEGWIAENYPQYRA